jgi:hypothetical protein
VSALTKVEAQKLMKAREVVIPNGYRVIDDEAFRRSDIIHPPIKYCVNMRRILVVG